MEKINATLLERAKTLREEQAAKVIVFIMGMEAQDNIQKNSNKHAKNNQ